jgi:hypothetical protein
VIWLMIKDSVCACVCVCVCIEQKGQYNSPLFSHITLFRLWYIRDKITGRLAICTSYHHSTTKIYRLHIIKKLIVLVVAPLYFLYIIIMPLHTEHTTNTRGKHHALSGIRIRDPGSQVAADPSVTLQGHQNQPT